MRDFFDALWLLLFIVFVFLLIFRLSSIVIVFDLQTIGYIAEKPLEIFDVVVCF